MMHYRLSFTWRGALLARASSLRGQTAQRRRTRESGLQFGTLPTGPLNAITGVEGVRAGHANVIPGAAVRTGTAGSNGSGDYAIGVSTARGRIPREYRALR